MVTVTYAHHSVIQGSRNGALYGLLITVVLAVIFTALQGVEYSVSQFTIADGTFGSCFYFGTGLTNTMWAPTRFLSNYFEDISKLPKKYNLFHSNASDQTLNPFWVTGFSDAESCFTVRISKDETRLQNLRLCPIFSIELHERDKILLEKIQAFFGVGSIIHRVRKGKASVIYSVQSIKSLKENIIPHFSKYHLMSEKRKDFHLFISVIEIMTKQHLNQEGLDKIIALKASMNKGLSKALSLLFPGVFASKVVRDSAITPLSKLNPFWVAGFVDGEGCFYVKINKKNKSNINTIFSIYQHTRDIDLLKKITMFFNCGIIEAVKTRPNQSGMVVYKFNDIKDKIIPFFENYCLHGNKRLDFCDFQKITDILAKNKSKILNKDLINEITKIKGNMNRNRYK